LAFGLPVYVAGTRRLHSVKRLPKKIGAWHRRLPASLGVFSGRLCSAKKLLVENPFLAIKSECRD
jgi:hypothetical protein